VAPPAPGRKSELEANHELHLPPASRCPVFGDALLSLLLLLLKFTVELMIPKPPLGVTGEYKYDPHQEKSYPNLHGVE
jgi:hypothetical protein